MHREAWKYYAGFYRGRGGTILFAFVLSVARSVVVLPIFALVKWLIDVAIPKGDVRSLLLVGGALIGLLALSGALSLLTRRITLLLNASITERLREDLVQKHYALSLAFMSKSDRSRLHTVFLQDVGRIEVMGDALVASILPSIFLCLVLVGVLFHLNWLLFLVLLVLFPALFFVTQRMGLKLKHGVDAFRRSFQDLSKRMWFVLWMGELTRYQAAEEFELARQREGLREFRDRSVDMAWLKATLTAMQRTMTGLFGIITLVAGGMAIAAGTMSLGALISFYVAARLLQTCANPLLAAIPTVITGNESLGEVYELAHSAERAPYAGTRKIDFRGEVSLRNVSFGYDENLVLVEANLSLKPGRIVVVLGPNGVGKSTIAHLVLGHYRPAAGELLADNVPYDEVDLRELRGQVGVVPQNPGTFSGTILENVTYGCPDIGFERVLDASRRAGSHAFISEFPARYDSLIGDNGVLISGGERQLIAICRALLRNPRLLILDEPTNHLGKEAVARLMKTLRAEKESRTTLIISHHWEIAREADHVYYLDKGLLREIDASELARLADVLAPTA